MGLPRPVASVHNSWLSQKGRVLAQTLLPGSKQRVGRSGAVLPHPCHPVGISGSPGPRPSTHPPPPGIVVPRAEVRTLCVDSPTPALCLGFHLWAEGVAGFQTSGTAVITYLHSPGEAYGLPRYRHLGHCLNFPAV